MDWNERGLRDVHMAGNQVSYGPAYAISVHGLRSSVPRSTIIDFPKATGPNKTHTALTKWVFDYFQVDLTDSPSSSSERSNGQAGSGAKVGNAFSVLMQSNGSSIHISEDKMPLYLQHQGHSRTIVGVERTKAGDLNLLLFDPGK